MSQMYDASITIDEQNNDTLGNMVTFYNRTVLDKKKTADTGCDHFTEEEWIKIKVRGDHTMEIDTKVNEQHREKYSRSYAKFKEGADQRVGDGYPVEQWAMIGVPMVKTLHGLDIYTVEQLAEFPDSMIHKLHQGQTYKQRAIKWLAERRGGDVSALTSEVNRLTKLVSDMQKNVTTKKRKRRTKKTVPRTLSAPPAVTEPLTPTE